MTLVDYLVRSTLKREIASIITFWWMVAGTVLMFRAPVTQASPDAALSIWRDLGFYVFGFDTAAFGADFLAKQTNVLGPAANTETTVTTEPTPTGGETVTTSSEPKP